MSQFGIDLASILRPYAAKLATRHIVLERGLLSRSGAVLRNTLPGDRWLLLADTTTWPLVGPVVAASLDQAGVATAQHIIETPAPVASASAVADLRQRLDRCQAIIALGSGSLNDIAKMAAHQAQIPYAVLATAPSMNGYTSPIAALLVDGVKTTQPCNPPVACLADLDLLAQAPYRMLTAGLGDLLSKPVSNADWLLARHLKGAAYAADAAALIEESTRLLEGVPAKLPDRDIEAVGKLMGGLCLSGLAMSVAGSSAPASGGEHLISHYLDMRHHALGEPNDLHGCQVGVATLVTAALYENLLALDPDTIDIDACLTRHRSWDEYERIMRDRFGPLAEAVVPYAKEGYPTAAELRDRLLRVKVDWETMLAQLRPTLRPVGEIRAELVAAHCPTTFGEIGVARECARRAVYYSKDIRSRYTILHLAAELGLLETWAVPPKSF